MSASPILTLGIGAFTDGGVQYIPTLGFGTGAVPPPADEFSASNWRLWIKRRKREREDLEEGVLPEELQAQAEAAIAEAQAAAHEQAMARVESERREALLRAMEAREAFEQAYRDAYGEAYMASIVAELWARDMRRLERRRAAAILLLH